MAAHTTSANVLLADSGTMRGSGRLQHPVLAVQWRGNAVVIMTPQASAVVSPNVDGGLDVRWQVRCSMFT